MYVSIIARSYILRDRRNRYGSGNFKNDNIILDSASNNLKIHEDYLDSVTFFDADNTQVVYYSPNNGDFVNLVVLSPAQYPNVPYY